MYDTCFRHEIRKEVTCLRMDSGVNERPKAIGMKGACESKRSDVIYAVGDSTMLA